MLTDKLKEACYRLSTFEEACFELEGQRFMVTRATNKAVTMNAGDVLIGHEWEVDSVGEEGVNMTVRWLDKLPGPKFMPRSEGP